MLRSNFIRSTSIFDCHFYVDIAHCALCQQKLTWVLMSTQLCRPYKPSQFLLTLITFTYKLNKFEVYTYSAMYNVDINVVVKMCDFCVDLMIFDLNNSTRQYPLPSFLVSLKEQFSVLFFKKKANLKFKSSSNIF